MVCCYVCPCKARWYDATQAMPLSESGLTRMLMIPAVRQYLARVNRLRKRVHFGSPIIPYDHPSLVISKHGCLGSTTPVPIKLRGGFEASRVVCKVCKIPSSTAHAWRLCSIKQINPKPAIPNLRVGFFRKCFVSGLILGRLEPFFGLRVCVCDLHPVIIH